MRRLIPILLLLCFSISLSAQSVAPVPGQLIVHLDQEVDIKQWLEQWNKESGHINLSHIKPLGKVHNLQLLQVAELEREIAFTQLQAKREVKIVQYNYPVESRATEPNDDLFPDQWNLELIQTPEVWDVTQGGSTELGDEIVVAVLDFGFEVDHPDLAPNVWINSGEVDNDGVDNDGNGYVDDVVGWNLINNTNEHFSIRHGQGVAGIIGARGDNDRGISGINWDVDMMLLSFSSLVSEIVEGLEYALWQRMKYNETNGQEGSFVVAVNESFGISRQFCDLQPVWSMLHDELGEAGVLTIVAVDNDNYNVDILGDMPATCPSNYQISVTNTTENDELFQNAAFGPESVDLGAPGENALSLNLNGTYSPFIGTSSATPHVTGVVALLYSLPCTLLAETARDNPAEAARFVRDAILNGVDPLSDLTDKTVTGGRLNAFGSLEYLQSLCGTSTGPLEIIRAYPSPTNTDITVEYQTPDFQNYDLRVYNSLGQEVIKDTIEPNRFGQRQFTIPVGFLQSGLYHLVLRNGNDRQAVKFVVMQ